MSGGPVPHEVSVTLDGFAVAVSRGRRMDRFSEAFGCTGFVWVPLLAVPLLQALSEPLLTRLVTSGTPDAVVAGALLLLALVWLVAGLYLTFTVPMRLFSLEDPGRLVLKGNVLIEQRRGRRRIILLSEVTDITVTRRAVVLLAGGQRHELAWRLREPLREWLAGALRAKIRERGDERDVPQKLHQLRGRPEAH